MLQSQDLCRRKTEGVAELIPNVGVLELTIMILDSKLSLVSIRAKSVRYKANGGTPAADAESVYRLNLPLCP